MKPPKTTFEVFVYCCLVILSLLALTLAATSPAYNFDSNVVYRGF